MSKLGIKDILIIVMAIGLIYLFWTNRKFDKERDMRSEEVRKAKESAAFFDEQLIYLDSLIVLNQSQFEQAQIAIDSLQTKKRKNEIIYAPKYIEIRNSNATTIDKLFEDIFTRHGIEH